MVIVAFQSGKSVDRVLFQELNPSFVELKRLEFFYPGPKQFKHRRGDVLDQVLYYAKTCLNDSFVLLSAALPDLIDDLSVDWVLSIRAAEVKNLQRPFD